MTDYSTEDILAMHAERLDAIERTISDRGRRADETYARLRSDETASEYLSRHQTTPGRVTMTFTTLKKD